MPELPEVQTTADDLSRKVVGRRIVGFWTDWPKVVRSPSISLLKRKIRGLKIESVSRLGKNVVISLSKGYLLVVHQKMTGHLMVGKWKIQRSGGKQEAKNLLGGSLDDKVNQYIHAIFHLDNGEMVALSDMRKFARIDFGKKEKVEELLGMQRLGPDALDPKLTSKKLGEIMGSRKKSIKQALMDPAILAGVGNIYADDILWASRVHPARPANSLGSAELGKVLVNMRKILKKAVRLRGTSVGDYRDTAGEPGGYGRKVLVYRKTGEPCGRCRTPIERIVLRQRSAHFCPRCQKL